MFGKIMTKYLCATYWPTVYVQQDWWVSLNKLLRSKANSDNRDVITDLLFPCTIDSDDQWASQHWSLWQSNNTMRRTSLDCNYQPHASWPSDNPLLETYALLMPVFWNQRWTKGNPQNLELIIMSPTEIPWQNRPTYLYKAAYSQGITLAYSSISVIESIYKHSQQFTWHTLHVHSPVTNQSVTATRLTSLQLTWATQYT